MSDLALSPYGVQAYTQDQEGNPFGNAAAKAYHHIIQDPRKLVTQLTSIISSGFGVQTFNQIEQLFDPLDYFEVSQFVRNKTFLIPILLEAYPHIGRLFLGFRYHLVLDVFKEDENDEGLLYLLIRTTENFDKIQPILEQLDETWWLGKVETARGKLVIDVEYV